MSEHAVNNTSVSLEAVLRSLTLTEGEDTTSVEENHAQEVTDIEDLGIQHIRLASFRSCNCLEFEPQSEHFIVCTWIDTIADTEAVAISYTWGAFDRKEHRVGHYVSRPQDPVVLTLGAEWSTAAFLAQLESLSQENGCWLDQVCAAQHAEQVSKTLASIPNIYMTLPVFVVLPGPKCGCLRKNFDAWESTLMAEDEKFAAEDTGHIGSPYDPSRQDLLKTHTNVNVEQTLDFSEQAWSMVEDTLIGNTCFTALGCCSWPERIWTFQETRYASQLTIVYADKTDIPCMTKWSIPSDFRAWPGYLGCTYRRLREKKHHRLAVQELDNIVYDFYAKAVDFRRGIYNTEIVGLKRIANRNESNHSEEILARCLLGETLNLVSFAENESIDTLSRCCERLGEIGLTATQPRDYVLSVFPGCTWYKTPPNVKSSAPFELLADAIQQMQEACSCYCPNTWPAGLFGATTGTAHWNLSLYCPPGPIKDSRDCYGAFDWSHNVVYSLDQLARQIPFHIMQKYHPKSLMTFADVFPPTSSSSQMCEAMTQVARYVEMHGELADENDLGDFQPYPWNTADAEASFFDFACYVAHLDSDTCRQQQLQLMFCMQELEATFAAEFATDKIVPRIGLINRSKLETIIANDERTITVSTKGGSEFRPTYEVVQLDKSTESEYAVVGIWLRTSVQFKYLKAEAVFADEEHECNALIV